MQVLPSVQPFHAIAYPIDTMLALEIRCVPLYMNANINVYALLFYHIIYIYIYIYILFCYFLCSRKYAAHCSLIASRFGLPPFVHPPPVLVKAEGKHCRLRVGYV
jgi:protein O-GlcNAc transferase